jgi:hypothetical protein
MIAILITDRSDFSNGQLLKEFALTCPDVPVWASLRLSTGWRLYLRTPSANRMIAAAVSNGRR